MDPAENDISNETPILRPMMQIQGKPILDYASPSAKSPLRMAEKSILTFNPGEGRWEVVESLAGHNAALIAIAFTSFTMTLLGSLVFGGALGATSLSADLVSPGCWIYFLGALGTIVLILAVIDTNWRKTILSVDPEVVWLRFSSLFRHESHQWPSGEVRHVKISTGVDSQTQRLVYELWIDLSFHGVVKLFTGHDLPELNAVVDAIRKHLPEEPPGSNTEGSTPDRPAGPIEVDYEERDTR